MRFFFCKAIAEAQPNPVPVAKPQGPFKRLIEVIRTARIARIETRLARLQAQAGITTETTTVAPQ